MSDPSTQVCGEDGDGEGVGEEVSCGAGAQLQGDGDNSASKSEEHGDKDSVLPTAWNDWRGGELIPFVSRFW